MEYSHKSTFKTLVCIWCGVYLPAYDSLRSHGVKCAIQNAALSEESWSLCTFCPTIFFFKDLTKSPFFIAHMNNAHRANIEQSWSFPCQRCTSIFPTQEAAEHHEKLCYKSLANIQLKSQVNSNVLPSIKIVPQIITGASKPKSALPSLKPMVTYQVCGLCSKTISGMPCTLNFDWPRALVSHARSILGVR